MAPKPQAARPNAGLNLLNLERVPPLAPKFANQIGKTCTGFRVSYTVVGQEVEVSSTISAEGADLEAPIWLPIPVWEKARAARNAPTSAERLDALRRKYEVRLNRAFPAQGPASGSEADIQAWLGTVGFAHRRALLMSQKDFAKSYPDGFREPQGN
jgi:hypothetical protein